MTDVGTAALQIIPSFQGFQGKLEQGVGGSMGAAGTSGGRKYGDAAGRSMSAAFGAHAKKAGLLAGAGLALAGAAVIKLGRDSLAEAREAQKVGALTEQVIKSTGGAAKVTAKEVGDLAGAISLKSGIDDEAIQSGANLLLTFTNVHNEVGKGNDIFDQATRIMTDMSVALGTDASGSAIQLGKALNDPIKGVTALSRVGVSFTEDQKEQIKTLVESGNTMAAQKIILGELNKEFGGAARAGATMGDKVSVAMGNIKEKIGTALLPMVDDLERAFLKKGVPAIEGMVDSFEKKGIPAIKDFVKGAKPLVRELLPAMGDALGTVRDTLSAAAPYARDLVGAFNDMPDWAKKVLVTGALGGVAAKKLGVGSLLFGGGKPGSSGGILGAFSKAAPMPVYVTNPGFGGDLPGGGKGKPPAVVGGKAGWLKALGLPALTFTAGYEVQKHFPKAAPFGDEGWMPGAPKEGEGWLSWFDSQKKGVAQMSAAARAEMSKTAAAFAKLPQSVKTDIILHGAPESKKAALELARQYDLTAADRKTLFSTSGIPEAKRDTTNLLGQYGLIPRHVSTQVGLTGVEAAQAQIRTLVASIHAIPSVGDHSLPYVSGGSRSGGGGKSTGGRVLPERVTLQVDGNEFNAHIREHARQEIDADRRFDNVSRGR